MAQKYTITVGPRAYTFHDQSTGITVIKGFKKVLTPRQYLSKKIQRALAAGHLVLVPEENNIPRYTDQDIEKLNKKMMAQISKGMEASKIAKGYSLEEAKLIAAKHDLQPDPGDTVQSLVEAIIETISE